MIAIKESGAADKRTGGLTMHGEQMSQEQLAICDICLQGAPTPACTSDDGGGRCLNRYDSVLNPTT